MSNLAQIDTTEEELFILDPHSPNGVRQESTIAQNYIAKISAGYKNEKGVPQRTKEGEIYVKGDAPFLEETLRKNGGKFLTVMFLSDKINEIVQQRFTEYNPSALLTYGDANSITVIGKGGERTTYVTGTPEYAAAISRCKVSVSIYFTLAQWKDDGSGADAIYNDGLAPYKLQFTSINALRNIRNSLVNVKKLTGGYIAGVPFDLFLRHEEHADPTGKRRKMWIWNAIPRSPQGITFSANKFRQFASYGQSQIGMLQLTAPTSETLEMAIADAAVDAEVIDGVIEESEGDNGGDGDKETVAALNKEIAKSAKKLWGADFKDRLADVVGQRSLKGLTVERRKEIIRELDAIGDEESIEEYEESLMGEIDDGQPLGTPDTPLSQAVEGLFGEDPFADEVENSDYGTD